MTERDYLCYEMNKDETEKWEELVADIKKSFYSIADISEIPLQVFVDICGRITMAKEPWNGAKGYINNSGFYYVEEGDRGKVTLIYSGYSYEAAKNAMVSRCAREISYAYVTKDMKEFQDKYKKQWHYCRINDGIETINGITRMKSHVEEQANWIYDGEYDYRKYWFESLLFMIKRILDKKEYENNVAYYEKCMNHPAKLWKFNYKTEMFDMMCCYIQKELSEN